MLIFGATPIHLRRWSLMCPSSYMVPVCGPVLLGAGRYMGLGLCVGELRASSCLRSFAGQYGRNLTVGVTQTLAAHVGAVVWKATEFAEWAGLNNSLRSALLLAAELHDSGKADQRFQAYLANGTPRAE